MKSECGSRKAEREGDRGPVFAYSFAAASRWQRANDRGQKTDVFEFGIGNAECGRKKEDRRQRTDDPPSPFCLRRASRGQKAEDRERK